MVIDSLSTFDFSPVSLVASAYEPTKDKRAKKMTAKLTGNIRPQDTPR